MRVAALDLGSNTSLLLVVDVDENSTAEKLKRVLLDETTITRLGQGVHADRQFHQEALARMALCFADYRNKMDQLKCERVIAVATSAARDVKNAEELYKLGRQYDIPIHIISGDREAELTFRGAICDREQDAGLAVIDVGGGSTEVIVKHDGEIKGVSVDVGSVRLSELFIRHDPITEPERAQIKTYVEQAFARVSLPYAAIREVVAVAGTPTTLAALEQRVEFSEEKIHGYKISLLQINQWIERLAHLPLRERAALPGMQPKRADVVVAGAMILSAALSATHLESLTVSTRGVRYGVALAWREF